VVAKDQIRTKSYRARKATYEEEIKEAKTQADYEIANQQLMYAEHRWNEQMRALATIGLTLLATTTNLFLDEPKHLFDIVRPPDEKAAGNGFYAGNLNVTGKLTKGSGSFKIDHPLDPANKYLSYSFVESPDMMNVYNGNITTDRHGLATVVLPDYFEALNQDFRYQLTVIGQFAQAIVKQEIENNRFTIKTNRSLVKVSWQVMGIRHDAYADA